MNMKTNQTETETQQDEVTNSNSSSDASVSENLSQNDIVNDSVDSSADQWDFLSQDEEVVAETAQAETTQNDDATDSTSEETETETTEAKSETQEATSTTSEETAEVTEEIDYEAIRQLLGEDAAQAIANQQQQDAQEGKPPQAETVQQPTETQQVQQPSAEQVQALRQQATETFEQEFQMSEEQVEEFRDNPNAVLPKLLAKAAMSTFDSLIQGVQKQLHTVVAEVIDLRQRSSEGEQAFYTVWPQLKDAKYRNTVNRIADTYRAANPTATREQIIREVGAQSWIACKLPLENLMSHVKQFQAPPKTTPAPQKTFRKPANAGHVPAGRVKVKDQPSEWEEFLDED